ncbi:MAG TPA: molybdenum ABC transporter ATP-binding protein [Phycisphaerales bacterium]|nr:molybdenum ABC transporter ATP-binding protein [Phycisphaerales bacterium]
MIRINAHFNRGAFSLALNMQSDAQVLGVFGPSGAGKTTIINLIAGLESPDTGVIQIGNQIVFDSHARVNPPPHRRHLGVVFQEHRLFPHYSVKGNLLYGAPRAADGFSRIVELLELSSLLQRRIRNLSGGERQRVALGRALLSAPRMLLLDEPLASLDVRLRRQIIPYLRKVRDELRIPMLYVSHDLSEILQLTDQLFIMDHGRSLGCGTFSDLIHEDAVLSAVRDRGMNNVLSARVHSHMESDALSLLEVGTPERLTNRLFAPQCAVPAGARVSISIQPWDIALAAHEIRDVSIQNQIPATVTRCTEHDRSMLIEADIGVPVIIEISRRAASALNIHVGSRIICLIKSHAIRYLDVS